ncbi:MAG TPA: radical SAM protein [Jatrophihabitans sp.]|nr:radical SAM protein [Jatrophihabitans sp.]
MIVTLVAGLGPGFKNSTYLSGSLFDRAAGPATAAEYFRHTGSHFDLDMLGFSYRGELYPLLRPRRGSVPHLTTATLESIIHSADAGCVVVPTDRIWDGTAVAPAESELVLLSTTFIWDRRTLGTALDWVRSELPDVPVVLGGQYTNLKWQQTLAEHPDLLAIVRGDGELAIPLLLQAIRNGDSLDRVPNLVYREGGEIRLTRAENIDLNDHPSPSFRGRYPVVPYESMRGCPFRCRFCSFPHASPEWRYKTAEKISGDWRDYAERNGTHFVKAMDSTFTVPPKRLAGLLELLPAVGVEWEGYSRANVIKHERLLDQLAAAHCRFLSIGFESMSDKVLQAMDKRVTAAQNRRAFELLRQGPVGYRCSFMTGYPSETPEDFQATSDFLVSEYAGHFMLSVFSLQDEQMPVWQDAERYSIVLDDAINPDYAWRHCGMDVATARRLNHRTLDAVRKHNDDAVLVLWQADYQTWLMPQLSARDNLVVEKTVERIGMLPLDEPDPVAGAGRLTELLAVLRKYGVEVTDPRYLSAEPLWEIDGR